MMMGMEWKQAVLFVVGIALASAACPAQTSAAGQAQTNNSTQPQARAANEPEFSIGGSFYKTFNQSSSGNGTAQTTTNSSGGVLELRYVDQPLVGFEFTYSYNPENQTLAPAPNCSLTCANPKTPLTVKVSEVGLDYVVSKKFGSIRPFAVGGLGFFISSPNNSKYEVNTVVRPAFIFGGGLDWAALSHFGFRAQFRDNVYKAPDLSAFYPPTGEYTHTAEPMAGLYFSF
jgi:opacity protein-like surface antigen